MAELTRIKINKIYDFDCLCLYIVYVYYTDLTFTVCAVLHVYKHLHRSVNCLLTGYWPQTCSSPGQIRALAGDMKLTQDRCNNEPLLCGRRYVTFLWIMYTLNSILYIMYVTIQCCRTAVISRLFVSVRNKLAFYAVLMRRMCHVCYFTFVHIIFLTDKAKFPSHMYSRHNYMQE